MTTQSMTGPPPATAPGLDPAALTERIREKALLVGTLLTEIRKVIVGQDELIERLLIGLLCNNHILIEGVPGLAKTLSVTTLARTIQASFQRIQFTPDLLPADLIGTLIYNPRSGDFTTRKGPIFTNIILADEINRAPAKVQSALLEAMQERQVTIGDTTHPLDEPFMVLATQNPIEQEGTYPLPEAQVDRFMLKLKVTYPTKAEERRILERMGDTTEAAASASRAARAHARGDSRAARPRGRRDPTRTSGSREYLVELVARDARPRRRTALPAPRRLRSPYGAPPPRDPRAPRSCPGPRVPRRARGTSCPRTSRTSPRTSCATASFSRTRPKPRTSRAIRSSSGSSSASKCPEAAHAPCSPASIVKKLHRIRIRTNRLVEAGVGGEYHSVFRGRGMDLAGCANTAGRRRAVDRLERDGAHAGTPYVRVHHEERDLTASSCSTLSPSQGFGSRYLTKRELMAEIAALLSFAAVKNNDRVGALLFTDRLERYHAPRKGVDHALAITRDALSLDAAGTGTDLALALERGRPSQQRSVVFVLSDFLAAGYEKALKTLNKRHDVVAIPISDPREREIPPVGLVRLRDAETGETRVFDASDPAFRKAWGVRSAALPEPAALFRASGIDSIALRTDATYEIPLVRFFKERERRKAAGR